jgi:hypothetical protein
MDWDLYLDLYHLLLLTGFWTLARLLSYGSLGNGSTFPMPMPPCPMLNYQLSSSMDDESESTFQ